MSSDRNGVLDVFFSYSHRDEALRDELEVHLALLRREGAIRAWHDRRIGAGRKWEGEIARHLESANLVLLLISPDFIASDYCFDIEMTRALERHEAGEARVIPVILRPADWQTARFAKLQALPMDGKPVTTWPDRDSAFVDVVRGIRAALEDLRQHRQVTDSPEAPRVTVEGLSRPQLEGQPLEPETRTAGSPPGVPLRQPWHNVLQLVFGLAVMGLTGYFVWPFFRVARPAAGDQDVKTIVGVEFAWRYIPSGTFQMGSPTSEKERDVDEPLHQVKLTRGFWMGETEVTQGQWQALTGNNPSRFKDCAECPVESVNWFEALAFANELSRRSKLEPCYELSGDNGKKPGEGIEYQRVSFAGLGCEGFRLPTEAEWEYAARAKTRTPFWTGEYLTTEQANFEKSVYRKTAEVRSYAANPWGLYEVHGNVWEWAQDAADRGEGTNIVTETYSEDPLNTRGSSRVNRGGGWASKASDCRAAFRYADAPNFRENDLGFRLVRTSR